jgi:hypothetical protein
MSDKYISPKLATHARIADADYCIDLDLADDEGNFTECVWSFDTEEEAIAAIPEFCANLGVEILPMRKFEYEI